VIKLKVKRFRRISAIKGKATKIPKFPLIQRNSCSPFIRDRIKMRIGIQNRKKTLEIIMEIQESRPETSRIKGMTTTWLIMPVLPIRISDS
jgi:hypothetical protein